MKRGGGCTLHGLRAMRLCQKTPHFCALSSPSWQPAPRNHTSKADAGRPCSEKLRGWLPGAPPWLLPTARPRAPQCRLCSPSRLENVAFVSSAQPQPFAGAPARSSAGKAQPSCGWLPSGLVYLFLLLASSSSWGEGDMRLLGRLSGDSHSPPRCLTSPSGGCHNPKYLGEKKNELQRG